jgi:hypothetical protein
MDMSRAKTVNRAPTEASDGRKLEVRYMDDGAIRLLLPDGPWVIAQHRTGPNRSILRLIRAETVSPDDEDEQRPSGTRSRRLSTPSHR